jgi:hypothetical protein
MCRQAFSESVVERALVNASQKEKYMEKDSLDERESSQNRRELLKSVGAALLAGSVLDVSAQEGKAVPKVFTIPGTVKTALQDITPSPEGKEFDVFFAHPRGAKAASIVSVATTDREAVNILSRELKGSPARAVVSGGIIHVNLGVAAEGRCTLSGAAGVASFRPGPGPVEKGIIVRGQ